MARLCSRRIQTARGIVLIFAAVLAGIVSAQIPGGAEIQAPSTVRLGNPSAPNTNGRVLSGGTGSGAEWLRGRTVVGGGGWNGGILSQGQIAPGMLNSGTRVPLTGIFNVSAPRVTLTEPANGVQFAAQAEIALAATVAEKVAALEFYDGVIGLGAGVAEDFFHYHLMLPKGLAAGVHFLRARVVDAHARMGWSPTVVVTVTASPHAALPIELAAPVTGSVYSAGSAVALRAVSNAPAAFVSRVEFYDGRELIGAVAIPASAAAAASSDYVWPEWLVERPGVHHLRARVYAEDGSFSDSSPIAIRVLPTLPYATGFESRENYRLGSLQGQLGWKVDRGSAVVSEEAAFDGGRSLELKAGVPAGEVEQLFGPAVLMKPTFVDLAVRLAAGSDRAEGALLDFDGARVGFFQEGSAGRFMVPRSDDRSGMSWMPAGGRAAIDPESLAAGWSRLSLRLDYAALTWDLFIDGRLAKYDLALDHEAGPSPGFRRFSARGGAATASYLDFFFAGHENPLFTDNDGDGMDDAWERANALDPNRNDRALDRDADGLTNLEEYFLGIRADLADSDGDGLPDAWEIRYHLDPLRPATESTDTDLDGLDDGREFLAGTDPTNADSDGDGLPDGWEAAHGFDALLADSSNDPDQDGVSNLEEYRRGTDPMDFFDQLLPRIQTLNGGEAGMEDELALIAWKPDGTPWASAPVTFRVTFGSRRIAAKSGHGPYADIIELRTDGNGLARVYLEPLEP